MRTLSFVNVLTSSFVHLREVEEASSFLGQSNQGKLVKAKKKVAGRSSILCCGVIFYF